MTTVTTTLRRAGLVGATLIAASAALPASASEGPRYTYGEIGYARIDFDNFDEDADAVGANGSFALNDRVYLLASYSRASIDDSGFDVDIDTAEAGAGMHFPLNSRVDLIAEAAYA